MGHPPPAGDAWLELAATGELVEACRLGRAAERPARARDLAKLVDRRAEARAVAREGRAILHRADDFAACADALNLNGQAEAYCLAVNRAVVEGGHVELGEHDVDEDRAQLALGTLRRWHSKVCGGQSADDAISIRERASSFCLPHIGATDSEPAQLRDLLDFLPLGDGAHSERDERPRRHAQQRDNRVPHHDFGWTFLKES